MKELVFGLRASVLNVAVFGLWALVLGLSDRVS